MSEITSIKFPLHHNKARVYDASGKYLFWISLAGDANDLERLRKKNESWIGFRNRTQPMRDALKAEELLIAQHFVEAINAHYDLLEALKASNDKLRSIVFDGDAHPLVAANNAAIAKAEGRS